MAIGVHGPRLAASFGLAMGMGAGADEPTPRERATARPAAAGEDRYLLLTDGRLIRGVISHDETTYTVTQKLGVIRFPKKLVERSFDTVREAYQYRLERLPEDDPGERLLLARWCLNLHMTAEAKAQLEKVLEISPDHGPARAMLTKITQSEASRLAGEQTKVDADGAADGRRRRSPRTAPEPWIRRYCGAPSGGWGSRGLPVIFGLPQTAGDPACRANSGNSSTRCSRPTAPSATMPTTTDRSSSCRRATRGIADAGRPAGEPGRDAATDRSRGPGEERAALEHAPAPREAGKNGRSSRGRTIGPTRSWRPG